MDSALFFAPEADGLKGTFYGRLAANQGLLLALARHGSGSRLHCATPSRETALQLRGLLDAHGLAAKELIRLPRPGLDLARHDIGALLRFDPNIGHIAWLRRAEGPETAFSICGLTHSLVEIDIMQWLGDLALAPLRPWDALICTSRAAVSLVEGVLDVWRDYLAERLGTRPARPPLRLPIIPLGIDTAALAPGADSAAARAALRQRLDLAESDIAVLFFGRLSHFEKAHPAPLYLALEEAAGHLTGGRRLCLIQAGRFPRPEMDAAYRDCAARLAPSVRSLILDGADAEVSAHIRDVADIFVSFSDNLQETFGLTPVEAMAAGLPVVVSDWDGYRDTIADGEVGFRIPTVQPPSGDGESLAIDHYLTRNHPQFLGRASQRTAVDVGRAAQAIATLANDADLRRRFGAGGIERARRLYDWSVVVPQYEELWRDLRACREAARQPGERRRAIPLAPDPFRVFAAFPTFHADAGCRVTLPAGWRPRLTAVLADPLCRADAPTLPSEAAVAAWLDGFTAAGGKTLGDLLAGAGNDDPALIRLLAVWLAKMHVLALEASPQ